ncbi:hypothetical protein BU17DRAFT_64937 [Hysterangium stoloniferum]|nr:hypothetical protein BU17DRAFT_64937 [Hysterangium stoloniferum]
MYSGIHFMRDNEANMIHTAKKLYLDLCRNWHTIKNIHIIAGDSGAFLAMKAIQFFHHYGTTLAEDMYLLQDRWKSFIGDYIFKYPPGHPYQHPDDPVAISPLYPLIRLMARLSILHKFFANNVVASFSTMILIQPSLPGASCPLGVRVFRGCLTSRVGNRVVFKAPTKNGPDIFVIYLTRPGDDDMYILGATEISMYGAACSEFKSLLNRLAEDVLLDKSKVASTDEREDSLDQKKEPVHVTKSR